MRDPKSFYRELDALLAKIRKEKSNERFLPTMLDELIDIFGESLFIPRGYVFERRSDFFVLIHSHDKQQKHVIDSISADSRAVCAVRENGSYIFTEEAFRASFQTQDPHLHTIPAAIMIHSTEREWLMIFELSDGWAFEETVLFLNAVRTALNYRLFSEAMRSELNMSARIQSSLLPSSPPSPAGFGIAHRSIPAESVGGDFYDYYQYDEAFGIGIGDASGHGLPAALLVRDVVIGLRMGLDQNIRLVHTLRRLNRVIQRSTYATNFVSMVIGEIENNEHLFYVNAGHPPPFLISETGCRELEATGIALGFMPDVIWHRSHTLIRPGDLLVFYTDGLIERERNPDEFYGIERLQKKAAELRHLKAPEILDQLFQHVFEYGENRPWADDATMVVIKRDDTKSSETP